MSPHHLPRPAVILVVILLTGTALNAQDVPTLVAAVDADPALTVSDLVRYEDETLNALFGEDLEAALDYGTVGVSRFSVARDTNRSEVSVYEMIDSAAAFGWFAHQRDYNAPGYQPLVLGAEAYANGARLVFWQSRFVVHVVGDRETGLELARVLSSTITGPSRKPTVSTLLPAAGRVAESERYLLTPSVIEEELGIDLELLGFENSVEAATATYRNGTSTATLALFQYPTPQLARIHAEAWQSDGGNQRPSRLSGLLFGIVPATNSDTLANDLLSELRSQFDVTWNAPPADPLTIQYIVLTAFTWIGIALLFTLVVGLGFGGLRVAMRKRYPTPLLGGELDTEFLQLNIDQRVTRHRIPD